MLQDSPVEKGEMASASQDDLFRLRAARDAALQAAQAAIRDTTRLTRLLTILSDPAPLDLLLDRALSALSELFAADIVVLLDPAGTGTFAPLAAIGLPEEVIDRPMSGDEPGYVAAAMRGRRPVLTTQASEDPKVDPRLRELGAQTAVWLPVFDTRSARGVLILARCRPLPFAHADADLLAAMAHRIGLALEQAQRSSQLEQIVTIGRQIGRHLDEAAVSNEAVRMLPSVIRADAAALVLCDSSGILHCVAQFGLEPLWKSTWSRFAERLFKSSTLSGDQSYGLADLHASGEELSVESVKNCPVRTLLAIPIRREERAHGLFFAMRFSPTPFSSETIQVANLYAGQISAGLENARLYRAVRESEQRFATAFQWSPIAIALTSLPEGRFLYVNETFLKDSEYSREEVVGRTHEQLGFFISQEDQDATLAELLAHGHVYAKECQFRTKSGTILTCLISLSTVPIDGRQCALSSVIDITERKRTEQELWESEERLKLALKGAGLGMWDWNVITGEVRFNVRWAEMLGYSSDELEPHLRSLERLIHPEDMPHVRKALDAHLKGTTPHYETEHRFLSKSGKWIWVLDKGKVTHRDVQGRPLRVIGTYLDITESKQIQSERLLMEQQKQQISRAESLNRMASGIAHHFNNLLGAVMGNLELALVCPVEETNPRVWITEALNASQRAAEISYLMLAYLGQTTTKKEALDLVEVTREALPLLIVSIPKNVRLKWTLPAEKEVILGDKVHIKQILTNLISNSAEAIGNEEGEITVEIGQMTVKEMRPLKLFPLDWEPQAESYTCLSVSDTGCGLDAASLERIFDPFFSTKFTGRGLGLSVVLGLVRGHGGAVTVESQPGLGTRFRLLFPNEMPEEEPLRKEESPPPAVFKGEGLILVVDDEPMVLRMAGAHLARLGYRVVDACDGFDAIEKFRARRDEFRLVLLDLTMPRMDGWEALAALRSLRPDIPVILTSGYDEAQVMRGDHPERPQAFLHKPYGTRELIRALVAASRTCHCTE